MPNPKVTDQEKARRQARALAYRKGMGDAFRLKQAKQEGRKSQRKEHKMLETTSLGDLIK